MSWETTFDVLNTRVEFHALLVATTRTLRAFKSKSDQTLTAVPTEEHKLSINLSFSVYATAVRSELKTNI